MPVQFWLSAPNLDRNLKIFILKKEDTIFMNEENKKISIIKKVIIGIVIVIIGIVLSLVIINIQGKEIYWKYHVNCSWGYFSEEVKIYDNGIIERYCNGELVKKVKISEEELNELKRLANLVEDNYTEEVKSTTFKSDFDYGGGKLSDSGTTTVCVYNSKKNHWYTISESSDIKGIKGEGYATEIKELEKQLYMKYITEKN